MSTQPLVLLKNGSFRKYMCIYKLLKLYLYIHIYLYIVYIYINIWVWKKEREWGNKKVIISKKL